MSDNGSPLKTTADISFRHKSPRPPYRETRFSLWGFRWERQKPTRRRKRWIAQAPIVQFVADHAPLGGLYADIGAGVGIHSVYYAAYLCNCLLTQERDPQKRQYLLVNLAENPCALYVDAPATVCNEDESSIQPGSKRRLDTLIDHHVPKMVNNWTPARYRLSFLRINAASCDPEAVIAGATGSLKRWKTHVLLQAPKETWIPKESSAMLKDMGYYVNMLDSSTRGWLSLYARPK